MFSASAWAAAAAADCKIDCRLAADRWRAPGSVLEADLPRIDTGSRSSLENEDSSSQGSSASKRWLLSPSVAPENRSRVDRDVSEDNAVRTREVSAAAARNVVSPGSGASSAVKLYRMRFWVLTEFCLLSFSSAYQWITFAPQRSLYAEFFDVSPIAIDYLSTIYMVAYVIGVMPGLLLTDYVDQRNRRVQFLDDGGEGTRGSSGVLRTSLLIAAAMNAVGCGLRFIGAGCSSFQVLFTGQTVSAVAQVFILGIPPRLATVWFGENERSTATSIGVVANNLGVGAGFLLSTTVVRGADDILTYFRSQFFFCAAILAIMVFALESFPRSPPSASQVAPLCHTPEKRGALRAVRDLFRIPAFRYKFLSYGIVVGGNYAVATLLESIVEPAFRSVGPLGSEDDENIAYNIGVLGMVFVLCGIVSTVLVGMLLDKTSLSFRGIGRAFSLGAIVTLAWFNLSAEYGGPGMVYSSSAAYGSFSTAIIPAAFQYAGELFFPIDDSTTATLLNTSAQIFGSVFITVMGKMRSDSLDFPMRYSGWFLVVVSVLGLWLQFLVDGPLRRSEMETNLNARRGRRRSLD